MEKTYLTLFILFSLLYLPCFSQSIDSLEKLYLKSDSEVQQVDLLNEIFNTKHPSGDKEVLIEAIKIAEKIDYVEGKFDAINNLGKYYYFKEDYKQGYIYFKQAAAGFKQLNLKYKAAYSLFHIGELKSFERDFVASLNYSLESEKLAIEMDDVELIALVQSNIAYVFIEGLEQREKGEKYSLKAIQTIESQKKPSEFLVNLYLNAVFLYLEMPKNDSVAVYLKKGEETLKKINDDYANQFFQPLFLLTRGNYHRNIEAYKKAKENLKKGLTLSLKRESWSDVAYAYNELSLVAKAEKNTVNHILYAKKSIAFDYENFYLQDNLSNLRDAFKPLNTDSFLVYNEKYLNHIDTLQIAEKINGIQEVLKNEVVLTKEQEIHEEKTKKLSFLILGIITSFLFGIGLLKFYRRSQKQKIQLAVLAEEKNHIKNIFTGKEAELIALREKVTTIERSLVSSQLNYERQQSTLTNITQFLRKMVSKEKPENLKKHLRALSREIESNLNQEDRWELFAKQFEQVHPQFFGSLIQQFPALNNKDLRLCAYVRLGMDNQEMGNILGIASSSVIKARHRMKKKMGLGKEMSLNQFLLNL